MTGSSWLASSTSKCCEDNSDYLCDMFAEGAREADHSVEKIFVSILNDDMSEILDKMIRADVLDMTARLWNAPLNVDAAIPVD